MSSTMYRNASKGGPNHCSMHKKLGEDRSYDYRGICPDRQMDNTPFPYRSGVINLLTQCDVCTVTGLQPEWGIHCDATSTWRYSLRLLEHDLGSEFHRHRPAFHCRWRGQFCSILFWPRSYVWSDRSSCVFFVRFWLIMNAVTTSLHGKARNTFCGTWYLLYSQVCNDQTVPIKIWRNDHISTSGLKSYFTIVFLRPNFL